MGNPHNSRPELVGAHDSGPTGKEHEWDKPRPILAQLCWSGGSCSCLNLICLGMLTPKGDLPLLIEEAQIEGRKEVNGGRENCGLCGKINEKHKSKQKIKIKSIDNTK